MTRDIKTDTTKPKGQAGFTIIELLIATAVFTIITLVITVAILQFSRQYYKGVVSSTTQGTARTLLDDVSRSIEFNSGAIVPTSDNSGYCIGTAKRYSYALNTEVIDKSPDSTQHQGYHGLVSDSYPGCNAATKALNVAGMTSLATPNAREILGQHMRLAKFDIIPTGGGLYSIKVRVIYGEDDLLSDPTSPDASCLSQSGSQYCATAELSTTVKQRIQ